MYQLACVPICVLTGEEHAYSDCGPSSSDRRRSRRGWGASGHSAYGDGLVALRSNWTPRPSLRVCSRRSLSGLRGLQVAVSRRCAAACWSDADVVVTYAIAVRWSCGVWFAGRCVVVSRSEGYGLIVMEPPLKNILRDPDNMIRYTEELPARRGVAGGGLAGSIYRSCFIEFRTLRAANQFCVPCAAARVCSEAVASRTGGLSKPAAESGVERDV